MLSKYIVIFFFSLFSISQCYSAPITLPGSFTHVDLADFTGEPKLVAVTTQGQIFKLKKDRQTWVDISAAEDKKTTIAFAKVSIGGDGAMWALDKQGAVYSYDKKGWVKKPGKLIDISCGNQDEVWGVDESKQLYQLFNPTGKSSWKNKQIKAVSVGVGVEGSVYLASANQVIDTFSRSSNKAKKLIRPADFNMGNPAQVACKNKLNVVFLDYSKRIWHLVPGEWGNKRDHWEQLLEKTKIKQVAIGLDGTIAAIDDKNNLLIRTKPEEEQQELQLARGPIVRANQVVRIIARGVGDGKRLWTHGDSWYDPNGKNAPPKDHLEVIVGVEKPDRDVRQDEGCFFSFTIPDKPDDNRALKYGDVVEIWSLYASLGRKKKSGIMGQSRKWWVKNDRPLQHDDRKWRDILVSLVTHPQANDGSQLFRIVSPHGKKGYVYSSDVVEIESLAAHSKDQKVYFKNDHYRLGKGFGQLIIPSPSNKIEASWNGRQLFQFEAVNSEDDLPQIPKTKYTREPAQVFRNIRGLFYQDVKALSARKKKANLVTRLGDGIAVLTEIHNYSNAILKTSIGNVKAKQSLTKIKHKFKEPLELSGYYLRSIPSVQPDQTIQLGKMYSQGFLWLNRAVRDTGNFLMTFLARAGDEGPIQLALNEFMSNEPKWRIIIGGWKNTKSAIVYRNKVMTEVSAATNFLARAYPGQWFPYWISLSEGFLMVGIGHPGENVFLSIYHPDLRKSQFVGLSSHQGNVDVSEVKMGQKLQPLKPSSLYIQDPKTISVPAGLGTIKWVDIPMRVPSEVSVQFDVQANHTASLVFASEKDNYQVSFGASKNRYLKLFRNGVEIAKLNTAAVPELQVFSDKLTRFWVSFEGNTIIVGRGEIGSNPACYFIDLKPVFGLNKIGFEQSDHEQTVRNITLAPPVTINAMEYSLLYQNRQRAYQGKATVMQPYLYALTQDGMAVKLQDKISGKVYSVMGTPSQTANYEIGVAVGPTGIPDVKILRFPKENPSVVKLQKDAMIKGQTATQALQTASVAADTLASISTGLMSATRMVAMASNDVVTAVTGGSNIALMAGLAAGGIAASVASATTRSAARIGAAALYASSKKDMYKAKTNFRGLDHYVYTEKAKRRAGISLNVPPHVERNQKLIEGQLVPETQKLDLRKPAQFARFIQVMQEIIDRTDHSYILKKRQVRYQVYRNFDTLVAAAQPYLLADYASIIKLLMNALSNPLLADHNLQEEQEQRTKWYNNMINIGYAIFNHRAKNLSFPIWIPSMSGEYLWLPGQVQQPDNFWVSFDVKAAQDVVICLAKENTMSRNSRKILYEIALGAWNNTRHEIRTRNLGRPAVFVSKKQIEAKIKKNGMLHPSRFKRFWVQLKDGTLSVGLGNSVGENTMINWKDPYPWSDIKFIGFSNWILPIQVKNIKAGLSGAPKKALGKQVKLVKGEKKLEREDVKKQSTKKVFEKKKPDAKAPVVIPEQKKTTKQMPKEQQADKSYEEWKARQKTEDKKSIVKKPAGTTAVQQDHRKALEEQQKAIRQRQAEFLRSTPVPIRR